MTRNEEIQATVAGRKLTLTRVVRAPLALVWRAFTEVQHVAHWWGPFGFRNSVEVMDVEPGGTWRFTMHGPDGTDYPNVVHFHAVEPERRLAFTHGSGRADEPSFEVEITFEPMGAHTKVTLEQTHASAERAELVARYAIDGGKQTFTRLAGYLASMRESALPSVIEGAIVGTDSADFVLTRVFAAPRALVYRAMTEADHMMKWFGPANAQTRIVSGEVRVGSTLRYAMKMGPHEMFGRAVYRELAEPERFAYIVSFTDSEGAPVRHPMSATWPLEVLAIATLTELDAKTLLVARSVPIHASEGDRETFFKGHSGMVQGFKGSYDQLERYLGEIQSAQ